MELGMSQLALYCFETEFCLSLTKFQDYMVEAGLPGVRNRGHTLETIRAAMVELCAMFPKAGALEM